MAGVKEKQGNIDECAESRKATITNLKFLLIVYEHTIPTDFSKKEMDIF